MALLTKPQLLEKIVEAIHSCGWNALFISEQHPFRLNIYNQNERYLLNIYIWNLTHGGGQARPENEYRIQIKVRNNLILLPGYENLLLGWWDDGNVFCGFDIDRHINAAWSASVQIKENALREAYENGFAISYKGDQEVAIAFRDDLFIEYIKNLRSLYSFGQDLAEFSVFEQSLHDPNISDEEIQLQNLERREVVRSVRQRIRNSSFNRRVLTAYTNRCAFCGIQLRLVEAAHIIPISDDRSTDETRNGIALCVLHHRAYDRAFITMNDAYQIVINERMVAMLRNKGLDGEYERFRSHLRDVIIIPPENFQRPSKEYINIANQIRGWR